MLSNQSQTLRIIDASLNRVGEGLRLLEEIARLLLNYASLTQQLKTMRHELIIGGAYFQQQLLQFRNSESDVGIDIEVLGEEKEKELPMVVVANSRRVQESLRTLEELAKVPGTTPELNSEKFKQARFNLYTIEQNLMSKLLRQDKLKHLSGLYVIIDTQALKGRHHLEVDSQAIRGGAKTIQLRDKVQSRGKLLPIAEQLRALCTEHKVVGLETLRQVRQVVTLPLVAIGGINKDKASEVIAAGADSVAVTSAVLGAESSEEAARQIIDSIETRK
ncbi:thiamine phosphate synthase [Chloroflexota bacterium]